MDARLAVSVQPELAASKVNIDTQLSTYYPPLGTPHTCSLPATPTKPSRVLLQVRQVHWNELLRCVVTTRGFFEDIPVSHDASSPSTTTSVVVVAAAPASPTPNPFLISEGNVVPSRSSLAGNNSYIHEQLRGILMQFAASPDWKTQTKYKFKHSKLKSFPTLR